ncbi:MAG: PD-(D/E)XK nuclease family protein [Planctomycetes bacterium]|nr:PD-(D/E)XK nuclease family protein [Planctomycetota bacterium]
MSNFRVLSASQLTTYATCTQQWAYRYAEKAPEESRSGALVLGSAVDVALKTLVHQVRSGEATVGTVKPKELLHEAWGAETSSKPEVPIDWGEKGAPANLRTAEALVEAFARLPDLEQRIARIVSVDLRFELPVLDPRTEQPAPGLGVQGILDFVERDADGKLRALDLKTAGSRAGWSPDDTRWHVQGSVYAWALKELHGDAAAEDVAFHIGFKLKEPVWEDRVVNLPAAARRRVLLSLIAASQSMDRATPFPQKSWACAGCAYSRRCDDWQSTPGVVLRRDPFAA